MVNMLLKKTDRLVFHLPSFMNMFIYTWYICNIAKHWLALRRHLLLGAQVMPTLATNIVQILYLKPTSIRHLQQQDMQLKTGHNHRTPADLLLFVLLFL
jgi:hypothetical protein